MNSPLVSRSKRNKSALINIRNSIKKPFNEDKILETEPSVNTVKLDKISKILLRTKTRNSHSPSYTFSKIARFESDIFEKFKREI